MSAGVGASAVYITNAWAHQTSLSAHTGFCHWAAPEYTTIGQTGLHAILSVISFAVAVWSAYEQLRVFNMRYQIAKGYADIAQDQWDRFNGKYKPLENSMIAEISAEVVVKPDYAKAKSEFTQFAETGFAQAKSEYDRAIKLFGICSDDSSIEVNKALWSDDMVNYGYRDAESYALLRDESRFNRRASLLNIGRDLLSNSAKYSGAASDLLTSSGEQAANTTQNAMTAVGYLRNKFATTYPGYMMYAPSAGVAMSPSNGASGGQLTSSMSLDGA